MHFGKRTIHWTSRRTRSWRLSAPAVGTTGSRISSSHTSSSSTRAEPATGVAIASPSTGIPVSHESSCGAGVVVFVRREDEVSRGIAFLCPEQWILVLACRANSSDSRHKQQQMSLTREDLRMKSGDEAPADPSLTHSDRRLTAAADSRHERRCCSCCWSLCRESATLIASPASHIRRSLSLCSIPPMNQVLFHDAKRSRLAIQDWDDDHFRLLIIFSAAPSLFAS